MKYLLILLMLPLMGLGQKVYTHEDTCRFVGRLSKYIDSLWESENKKLGIYNNLLSVKHKYPYLPEIDTAFGVIHKFEPAVSYNTLYNPPINLPFAFCYAPGEIKYPQFEINFDTSIFAWTNSPELLPNASVITLQDSIREDKYQKLAESAAEVLRYVTTEGYVLNKNRVKFNIAVKKHLQLLGDKSKYKKMQKLDILVRDIHGKAIGWVPQ